ncbi:MAG: hypothetical protein IJR88_01450 [Clostridia bacterium]|nr:hypothetical protein [Clostridia bacterium]
MFACSKFTDWFSKTLVGELLAYLKTRYFTLQFGNYEHIPVSESFRHSLEFLLYALAIGIVVAVAAYLRHRAVAWSLLSALESAEATAPDKAKTLEELGLAKRFSIRRILARPTPLSHKVLVAKEAAEAAEPTEEAPAESPDGEPQKAEKAPDIPALALDSKELAATPLFLPGEDLASLKEHYRRRGHPALVIAVTVLLSTVTLALVMRFLPFVLGLVDTIL